MSWPASTYAIFEILDDCVPEGTKAVGDPEDFKLLEMWGSTVHDQKVIAGRNVSSLANNWRFIRKPEYTTPNAVLEGSFGTNAEDSEWIVDNLSDEGMTQADMFESTGNHSCDSPTRHISAISSPVYRVDEGARGDLTITGVSHGENVEQFLANIVKRYEGQSLRVLNRETNEEKTMSNPVGHQDMLQVYSADSSNVSKYVLFTTPLNDNAVLTVIPPAKFEIIIDGDSGMIRGVEYGAVLKEILDSLKAPDLASMNVIDQHGNLVPMQRKNYHSVEVETVIGDSIFIEVVAENGNKITYRIDPVAASSDAFVISTIYRIDQDSMIINDLPMGTTPETFWRNIELVENATATLLDEEGSAKESGQIAYDDKLVVTSEDQSVQVVYLLAFLDAAANEAPSVNLAFDYKMLIGVMELVVSATVYDDGNPFGSSLSYKWEVVEGDAGNVSFDNDDALATRVTFTHGGTYNLQLAVSDGDKTTSVQVSINLIVLDINKADIQYVKLYPNPASNQLTIELVDFNGTASLKIFDLTGKLFYADPRWTSGKAINVSEFDRGIYLVNLTIGQEGFTRKLTIIR